MKIKRIISFVLVMIMLAGICCTGLSAASTNVDLSCYKNGKGYVAFGDSITRGYEPSDKWKEEGYKMDGIDDPNCRLVTGSYPLLVAQELGLYAPNDILDKDGEYWPLASDAVTTDMVNDLFGLEDKFVDEEYVYAYESVNSRYRALLYYFGIQGKSVSKDGKSIYNETAKAVPVDELIRDASLITIATGMSDILNRSRSLAMDGNTEMTVIAKELVKRLWEGYNNWKVQYAQLLDYMADNTEATVVIIGSINPLYGITLSEDYAIPVGSAVSAITGLMNKQYAEWADEYDFLFVDISNVETGTTDRDGELTFAEFMSSETRDQGIATHPTAAGYRQIARMIINALKENEVSHKTNVDNIVVDLGRFESVTEVFVNGKKVTDYTVENNTLYIPSKLHNATSLVITVKRADGSTAMTTYQLSYNAGYTAYRLYTTNNVASIGQRILQVAKNIMSKVVSYFR